MRLDWSQLSFGAGIGIIIIAFALIYDSIKALEKKAKENEKRLDAFAMWWTGQEKDEVKNQAIGEENEEM